MAKSPGLPDDPRDAMGEVLAGLDERIARLEAHVPKGDTPVHAPAPAQAGPRSSEPGLFLTGIKCGVTAVVGQWAVLYFGWSITGPDGLFAGVAIAAVVTPAVFVLSGSFLARFLGGLFVGSAAATLGLILEPFAAVWGGAFAGVIAGLLGLGHLGWQTPKVWPITESVLAWVWLGTIAGLLSWLNFPF